MTQNLLSSIALVVLVLLFETNNVTSQIEHVAEVEGKQYYAQYSLDKSWTAAKQHCEDLGMVMASITSRTQAEALRRAHSDSFSGSYWTSGRDALQLRQFSWDADNQEVSSEYIELFHWAMEPQTCLTYLSAGLNKTTMIYYPCTYGFGILCENGTVVAPTTEIPETTPLNSAPTKFNPIYKILIIMFQLVILF